MVKVFEAFVQKFQKISLDGIPQHVYLQGPTLTSTMVVNDAKNKW